MCNQSMTWDDFITKFNREFVSMIEIQRLAQDYLALKHTIELVVDIISKFRERILLFPTIYDDRGDQDDSLHDMLRIEIREYMNISSHKNLFS